VEVCNIPCRKLEYNVPGTIYVAIEVENDDLENLVVTFQDVYLKYVVIDCDATTGRVIDEDG